MSGKVGVIELGIFTSRLQAICEEMGSVLKRMAFSPNIKDRLDFSCAIFDAGGELLSQAAHIPVHLGSMAFAMKDIVNAVEWNDGRMIVLNDPFRGGTHLPDVTVIAPLFINGERVAFVANRAHHADIGASTPGSMPVSSSLHEEGFVISPEPIYDNGKFNRELLSRLTGRTFDETFPVEKESVTGDFVAQVSTCKVGLERLCASINELALDRFGDYVRELNNYAERLASASLGSIPAGSYRFTDYLDDDGQGNTSLPIKVAVNCSSKGIHVDFTGTAPQVAGNVNAPLSVTAAATFYVFRCLMQQDLPDCEGAYRRISIQAPEGCLLNARYPAAVAAGNVETSMRIVDAVLGAMAKAIPDRIPAASAGSMNNVVMGQRGETRNWDYYETLAGGMGASVINDGQDAVQTHMTNTLNTPVESLEMHYPVRIIRYALARDSGGKGLHTGGCGIIREYEFLEPAQVTLLTERRKYAPWGLQKGQPGKPGLNSLNGKPLPGKISFQASAGDRLCVQTPGGGGWGLPGEADDLETA